jgi:hypothetical protein
MATTEHNGERYTVDSIVVYTYNGSGTRYGYKLLKQVWISEIGEYRWVANALKIVNNEIIKYVGDSLELISDKEIKDGYPQLWTKDPEYKKGDILVGTDKKSGSKMLFVYLAQDHVERLTPRSDMMMPDQFGYSTLSDYSTNFGPLTVHKTLGYALGNNKKFSDL